MADKKNRLDPKLPRGFADRGPADIRAVDRMMQKIKAVYERYGFEPVETPFVEYTEALGKFLPDQDRPNEGVFSFQDDDDAWLSLRYDLTAPLARYVAANYDALPKPYRSYRAGWVFRNEKPGPGRFRQFMQFDADTVGASSPAADAEICMMVADVFHELGFERGQYVVKVSSRQFLDGWRQAFGLEGSENDARWLVVMRALDKADRVGLDGVSKLLGAGRLDDSGDFTKGAGLEEAASKRLVQMLSLRSHVDFQGVQGFNPTFNVGPSAEQFVEKSLVQSVRDIGNFYRESESGGRGELSLLNSSLDVIEEIGNQVRSAGFDDGRIQFDPSVVRGLEYYTGPVFEAQLTFEVPNEKGEPVVFGSVGGGGRYDGLVGRFRGEDVPATGFSVGVSRLASALKAVGKLGDEGLSGPVVVTVMDKNRLADYQKIVADLRNSGVAAEMYLGASGMKAQLKYADRRNSPAAIIAGSQEFESGKLQVKDLAVGKAQASAIADHQTWKEERPGQFEVAAGELVAKVKELLQKQRGN